MPGELDKVLQEKNKKDKKQREIDIDSLRGFGL